MNNAGRSQRATWENIELAVDKKMFDLNVFGVVNLSRVALEYFNKVGRGHLVVVSSIAGVVPVPYSGTYTATKFSIHVSNFNLFGIEVNTRATIKHIFIKSECKFTILN